MSLLRFFVRIVSFQLKTFFYLCAAMTQEQLKDMRDRVVVLRRFL